MLNELIAHGIKPSELKTKDGYNKHIHLDGSREHVLSYSTKGVNCSNKKCIINTDNKPHYENTIFLRKHTVKNALQKLGELTYSNKNQDEALKIYGFNNVE